LKANGVTFVAFEKGVLHMHGVLRMGILPMILGAGLLAGCATNEDLHATQAVADSARTQAEQAKATADQALAAANAATQRADQANTASQAAQQAANNAHNDAQNAASAAQQAHDDAVAAEQRAEADRAASAERAGPRRTRLARGERG
jgi:hypothetical protein